MFQINLQRARRRRLKKLNSGLLGWETCHQPRVEANFSRSSGLHSNPSAGEAVDHPTEGKPAGTENVGGRGRGGLWFGVREAGAFFNSSRAGFQKTF